jgi:hypothetical protein
VRSGWKKRAAKPANGFSRPQVSNRRDHYRPFLEQLESRTTPAFVSGVIIPGDGFESGAADLVAGDFNNDHKLDFIATTSDRYFQLYEGNGDGTFQSPVKILYQQQAAAYSAAAADLNGDGKLDLVSSDTRLGNISVNLGNGDGTFQDAVYYTPTVHPGRILVADIDGSGRPDILFTGGSSTSIGILLNRGDGTFVKGTYITTPFGPGDITLGHFYGHADRLDLAVSAVSNSNELLVYQGNGDGTFQTGQVVEPGTENMGGLTTADVNKDGKDDLIAACGSFVQVFIGNGDGTFKEPVSYTTHASENSFGGRVVTADLRNNGRVDLIVTNAGTSGDVSVLLGNDDGTFQPSTNYVFNNGIDAVAAADFDRDGRVDVLLGDLNSRDIEILKGNGNGTLRGTIDYATPGTEGIGYIASGDLNHDGAADLITVGHKADVVDVWIGNGDGSFLSPVSYQVGNGPQGLCLADVNGDGNLDIIVANSTDTNDRAMAVLLGNSDGTFKPAQYITGRDNTFAVTAVDLNGDKKLDLATVSPNSNSLSLYFGNGDGTFQDPVSYSTDGNPTYVSAADFNGDGKPDLLVTAHGVDLGDLDVFVNRGDGSLQIPPSAQLETFPPSNGVAYDLRNNGINDLLAGGVGFCLGNGNGTFQAVHDFEGEAIYVSAGDFDGDGIADLALCGAVSNEVTLCKGDGAGGFTPAGVYPNAGPSPGSMAATDLNNDGALDLAVADTGGNSITILRSQPSDAVYFLLTAQSTPWVGQACQFVVTAINSAGQTIPNYSGKVHFTSNDPHASLPADITLTNGVGVVSTTFNTVGADYLRAADLANHKITGTSASFSVKVLASPSDHLSITIAPGPFVANQVFAVTVTLYDSGNNIATGYRGQIHFTSTDVQAFLPHDYTFTIADQGSHSFSAACNVAGLQSITAGDTSNANLRSTVSFVIIPAAPRLLHVTGLSSTATAGQPMSIVISALDTFGNVVPTFADTVQFSSSDPRAMLPSAYTYSAADQGTHQFSFTLYTAGTQTLTFGAPSVIGDQRSILVNIGSMAGIDVTAPSGAVAGVPLNVVVKATDAGGNVITNYTGTVHFTSTDPRAVLPADYTFFASDKGTKTFGGVELLTAGTSGFSVTDSADSSLTGSEGGIVVSPASASSFTVTSAPTEATAGVAANIMLTVKDLFGNVATGYRGTIHVSSTDSQAILPGNYAFTAADGGVKTVAVTFGSVGSQTLTFADVAAPPLVVTTNSIAVSPGNAANFTVSSLPTQAGAGVAATVTLTVRDSYGNVATGYRGTIHISSTDSQAMLPGNYLFSAADQGVKTLTVTFRTAGSQTLTFADLAAPTLVVTTNFIGVSPANAASFTFTSAPTQATAGVSSNFTLTVRDVYGNVATGYLGTIHVSSGDPQAVLPDNYTFSGADGGVKALPVKFKTAGLQSLTLSDVAVSALAVTTNSINIVSAAAANFTVNSSPTQATAGTAENFTLTVRDLYGNVATGYLGTIHIGSTDSQAALPANYTFAGADGGVKALPVTFKTAGSQTLTFSDVATPTLTVTTNATNVFPANAAGFTVTGAPTQTTAGVAANVMLTVRDVYGNAATGYRGTIHVSSTDPQAVLPGNYTFTGADGGVRILSATFRSVGSQTLTFADVAAFTLAVTTNSITVTPANAAGFTVSSVPTQASAGIAASVTLTARDVYGNVATGYLGTIHVSSTDSQAVLPGKDAFTGADGGVKTLPVTFRTAGTQTLTFADVAAPALVLTTNSISVLAGPVAKLAFLQQPITGVSGVLMKPAITVELLDAFGNIESSNTSQVSLTLGDSSNTLKLSGNTSVVAMNGVATFSNVIVSGSGIGLTLLASTSGLTSVSSAKFNRVQLSNILPVVVAPSIYGPGPNASAQDAFIKGVYRTLLGRDADAPGLAYWTGKLNGGTARSTLIDAFWNSPENRGREVDTYYQVYLGRSADQGGHDYWVSRLQGGADETAIVLSFLLSAEELSAPNNVFVQRLYQGALGRSASDGEVNYWVGQLTQGATRQQVANSFVFSTEAAGVAVDSFYQAYLERYSDAPGRAYWVGQISGRSTSYASLAIALLESDEFFKNAATNVP